MAHEHDGCCGGHGKAKGEGCFGGEAPVGACCQGEAHKAAGACCKDQAGPEVAAAPADFEVMDPVALVMRYRRGIEHIDRRVFELTEEQIDTAFLPEAGVGRWPVRVLIGHLADAELVFSHRLRRAVGEERPLVSYLDENAFIDAGIYGNGAKTYAEEPEADHARVMAALGGPLAVVHTLRQWTGQWLLTLSEDQWKRVVLHPEKGEQTIKRILSYTTWHMEHHGKILTRKLDRMLGPAVEAGCGSGCGCGG